MPEGPGTEPLGKDLRALETSSLEIWTARGGGSGGRVGILETGCLASISTCTSLDDLARPADVRDCRAFLY